MEETMAQMQEKIEALYLANAVMFRRLLHIFVLNAGDTKEERAAFHKKLFDDIMREIKDFKGSAQMTKDAESIVMAIFGIGNTGREH
jgi:hypothetical protein